MTPNPNPSPELRGQVLSRSSFSAQASRMNLARPYFPTRSSIAASMSAAIRIGVGFMSRGGRPIGRGIAAGVVAGKKTIPFSFDGLIGTGYINGIVYGDKSMRYRQGTYGEHLDAYQREVERLVEVAKRHPQRATEVEQGRKIVTRLKAQMRRLGKRRSSCFYGFDEVSA